jgi:hypothetical protein
MHTASHILNLFGNFLKEEKNDFMAVFSFLVEMDNKSFSFLTPVI